MDCESTEIYGENTGSMMVCFTVLQEYPTRWNSFRNPSLQQWHSSVSDGEIFVSEPRTGVLGHGLMFLMKLLSRQTSFLDFLHNETWVFADFYSSCPTIGALFLFICQQSRGWLVFRFLDIPKIQAYLNLMAQLCSMIAWKRVNILRRYGDSLAGTVKRFLFLYLRSILCLEWLSKGALFWSQRSSKISITETDTQFNSTRLFMLSF